MHLIRPLIVLALLVAPFATRIHGQLFTAPYSSTWPNNFATFQLQLFKVAGKELSGNGCTPPLVTFNGIIEDCDMAWAHLHHGDAEAETVTLGIYATSPGVTGDGHSSANLGIEVQYYVHGIAVSDWLKPPYTFQLAVNDPDLDLLPNGIHDISADVRFNGVNMGAMSTTVASANSASLFTVQNRQGAHVAVGDYVYVRDRATLHTEQPRRVSARTGDQLTVAPPLPTVPAKDDLVVLMKRNDFYTRPIYLHFHRHPNPNGTSTLVPLIDRDCQYCTAADRTGPATSLEYVDATKRDIRTWPLDSAAEPWTGVPSALLRPSAPDLYQEQLMPHSNLFQCSQMWWEEPPSSPEAGLKFARCLPPKFEEVHTDPWLRVTWAHERFPYRDGGRGVCWISGYAGGMVDTKGNFWFVEPGGRFGKLAPDGTCTTYAGYRVKPDKDPIWITKPLAAIRGNMDFLGTWPAGPLSDGFRTPLDVAQDPQNTNHFYIAGEGDNLIWKVDISTSPATITVFAGSVNRAAGYTNGTGIAAQFSGPTSVVWDLSGTYLYVADQKNDAIRRIDRSGVVTTVLGQKPGEGRLADKIVPKCAATVWGEAALPTNRSCSRFTGTDPDSFFPMVVRMFSNGDLAVMDLGFNAIRRYVMATDTASALAYFPARFNSAGDIGWSWMDVDRWGKSGPLDGIYFGCFQCSTIASGDGTAVAGTRVNEAYGWVSSAGTAHWIFGPDDDQTPDGFGSYYHSDPPHYYWTSAVDPRGGVILAGGGESGLTRLRKRRATDPDPQSQVDYFAGDHMWVFGPYPSGISYALKYGYGGFGYLGYASSQDITKSTTDQQIKDMFAISDAIWKDKDRKRQILDYLRANRGPARQRQTTPSPRTP